MILEASYITSSSSDSSSSESSVIKLTVADLFLLPAELLPAELLPAKLLPTTLFSKRIFPFFSMMHGVPLSLVLEEPSTSTDLISSSLLEIFGFKSSSIK